MKCFRNIYHRAFSRDRKAPSRCGGFSLVELMVVMGIIVILAAMIFAGVSKARAKASSVKCVNNLRVLYRALYDHLDANGGKFPKVGHVFDYLPPRMGLSSNTVEPFPYSCPSARWPGFWAGSGTGHGRCSGYGPNPCLIPPYGIHAGNINNGGNYPGWDPDEYVYIGRIKRPTEIVLFADAGQMWVANSASMCAWWGEYHEMRGYNWVDASRADEPVSTAPESGVGQLWWYPPGETLMNHRHSGLANAIFLDGHVEAMRWGTLLQRNIHTLY